MKILFFILAALLSCSWANAQENVPAKAVLFEDSFDDIDGTGGNDTDGWFYNAKAEAFPQDRKGWSYPSRVYKANFCIRVGNGQSYSGTISTKELNYVGAVVLTFKAAPCIYKGAKLEFSPERFVVSLSSSSGSTFRNGEKSCTPDLKKDTWTSYDYKIDLKSNDTKISFTWDGNSYGNFFLDEVKITKDFYHRTGLTEGNFGTICMPFAVKQEDLTGATMYNIAYKITDGNGKVTGIILSEETGDLVAGKPYIFKATATELFAIYNGTSVTDAAPATGLVGNLSEDPAKVPQQSFILSGNQLRMVNGGSATVGQNRAYINLEFVPEYTSPASLSKEYIYFDLNEGEMDLEDGISAVKGKAVSASAFDLMGRKVAASGTKKGLIVKGGRKLVNVK